MVLVNEIFESAIDMIVEYVLREMKKRNDSTQDDNAKILSYMSRDM